MSVLDNPRIKKLLNCFDTNTQAYLLDFCDRISNLQADVYIIMARKASCFFNCLEELGLIHFNGYVTSERILDMSTDWLKDKSVVIIDDAIVSGTSIYKTIEKLKEADVKSIDVHVLTVNEKWFQPKLLTDDKKDYLYHDCNKQPDSKCIDLCYSLVNAILIQPRPYDIDFPLYTPIKLDAIKFNHILNNMGWSSHDVSSSVQKENNVFSLSILPNNHTIDRFSKLMGFNFNKDCFIKIRIYGTHISKKKELYELRVVPMVILNKLSTNDIDSLFNALLKNGTYNEFLRYFTSYKSKLRLLQFYFATQLSKLWFEDINYILNANMREITRFSERNLSFLFPKEIIQYIDSICQCDCTFGFLNNTLAIESNKEEFTQQVINPIATKVILTEDSQFVNRFFAFS